MDTTLSRDGTAIAYETTGTGPALIFVNGALTERSAVAPVAALLASHFTVFAYDRRGRGDSGDTYLYAPVREVEDLEAVIRAAGGQAFVFGHSSGAAIALEAAVRGLAITRLALYEPPYIVDDSRPPLPADFVPILRMHVAAGHPGDAVEHFWRVAILMPPEAISQIRNSPMWPKFEAIGRTVPYDAEVLGDHASGKPLPAEWARMTIPTLVIDGGNSSTQLRNAAAAVAALLPNAESVTLEGQGHGAPPEVLAPVLETFFGRPGA